MTPTPNLRCTHRRSPAGSSAARPAAGPLARLLSAAAAVDDQAVAALASASMTADGTLASWESLLAPVLRLAAAPEPTARTLALTAGLRQALDERLARLTRPGRRPRVMLATAPGEDDGLPVAALAAALLEQGVESWRLGVDVPWAALSAAVAGVAPPLLVVWSDRAADRRRLTALEARHPAVTVIAAGPAWGTAPTVPAAVAVCLALTRPLPRAV